MERTNRGDDYKSTLSLSLCLSFDSPRGESCNKILKKKKTAPPLFQPAEDSSKSPRIKAKRTHSTLSSADGFVTFVASVSYLEKERKERDSRKKFDRFWKESDEN